MYLIVFFTFIWNKKKRLTARKRSVARFKICVLLQGLLAFNSEYLKQILKIKLRGFQTVFHA